MSDNYNDQKFKKILAQYCVDNKIEPHIIDAEKLKGISIKPRGEQKHWYKIENSKDLQTAKNALDYFDVKLKYVNRDNEPKELIIKNVNDIVYEPKDEIFNVMGKDDNNKLFLYSTTDFMEKYLAASYAAHPELDTQLNVLHRVAQKFEKPLILVPGDVIIEDKSVPEEERERLRLKDVEEGMPLRLTGDMYSPDMPEVPEVIDTLALACHSEEFDSFEITVVEGPNAIYVSYDRWPDLYLELEAHSHEPPPPARVVNENMLLAEWWIQRLAEKEKEKDLGPKIDDGESYPSPPPEFPGEISDPPVILPGMDIIYDFPAEFSQYEITEFPGYKLNTISNPQHLEFETKEYPTINTNGELELGGLE